jgi:hypothetical protein
VRFEVFEVDDGVVVGMKQNSGDTVVVVVATVVVDVDMNVDAGVDVDVVEEECL